MQSGGVTRAKGGVLHRLRGLHRSCARACPPLTLLTSRRSCSPPAAVGVFVVHVCLAVWRPQVRLLVSDLPSSETPLQTISSVPSSGE